MTGESRIARRRRRAVERGSPEFEQRRRAIMNAATELFAEQGVERTTFADIGARAGVNRSLLYYYFPSKDDLFLDVVLEAIEMNVERLTSIAESPKPASVRLREAVCELMESYSRHYPHMYAYVRTDISRLRVADRSKIERTLATADRYVERFVSIVRDGQAAGEFYRDASPEVVAYGILGMLNWTHQWYRPGGRYSASEIGVFFSRLALHGVLAVQDGA